MKVRVCYRPDKTVAVIHPVPGSQKPDESEEQWLERIFAKAMSHPDLKGLPFDDIDENDLPRSREDREAWEGEKGKGIKVNPTKADAIRNEKRVRELIQEEKNRILDEQAIANLKKQGKI